MSNKETKHTPGPWETLPDGDTFFIRVSDKAKPIAKLTWACIRRAELKANARLIAAAPELLEALEDALACLERLEDKDGAYRVTCIQQCKQAIAKAKGTYRREIDT